MMARLLSRALHADTVAHFPAFGDYPKFIPKAPGQQVQEQQEFLQVL